MTADDANEIAILTGNETEMFHIAETMYEVAMAKSEKAKEFVLRYTECECFEFDH